MRFPAQTPNLTMASQAKMPKVQEDTESVEGYIHDVSPVKVSKNNFKYFNAVFQEKDSFSDMVCFRADLNVQLQQLESNRTPVKLTNITKSISRNKPGSFDIKIKSATQVTPARQLQFRFEQPPESKLKTIDFIKENEEHQYSKKCGLTLASDVNDLALQYLAAIQALAYGTRHVIEEMNKAGHKIEVIYICGGLRKNMVFVKAHTEVTGLPVIVPLEEESVLIGAAILGATASKDFKSIQDAIQNMGGRGIVVSPNPEESEYHQKKYKVFLKMLDHQREYHSIMNA